MIVSVYFAENGSKVISVLELSALLRVNECYTDRRASSVVRFTAVIAVRRSSTVLKWPVAR